MKKILIFLLLLVLFAAGIATWILFGSATGFERPKETLYIRSNAATKQAVMDSLKANKIITNETAFEFLANRFDYWKNIKPGRYDIKKGSSLLSIIRMLRNGRQTDVNLVITKLRTKEDFARLVGMKFECDSMQMINFMNSADSLKNFEAAPEVSMWNLIPDTYTYHWNSSPTQIYQKIYNESKRFWNSDRKLKSQMIGLSPLETYILASIIEEETTNHEEKDTIASVYLNRLKIGMALQADPTVKFAARDFAAKVISGDLLNTESPYNTYHNTGLPPGPICTPSRITIDAVLNPATTPYLYFVARRSLKGHLFSTTLEEHNRKAADYKAEYGAKAQQDKNSAK